MRAAFAVDPVLMVLIGIATVQLGAAFAKDLFIATTPSATAWLGCASRKPDLSHGFASRPQVPWTAPPLVILAGYGVALAKHELVDL